MQAINEAKRYIDNAKQILKEKAHKEDGLYSDKKYVKMAVKYAEDLRKYVARYVRTLAIQCL